MTVPAVTLNELDGALGALPSGVKALAVVGVCSAGPTAVPAAFARTTSLNSTHGVGPAVECGAYSILNYGRPVIMVRTGQTVAGSHGTLDVTGFSGTSVPTIDAPLPIDDTEVYIKFVTGGTVGTAGITYQWSLDNGRTLSGVTALGTAVTLTLPENNGIGVDLAAGTIVAGSVLKWRTIAPQWNTSELGAALDALRLSNLEWDVCVIVGNIDAAAFDAIVTAFGSMKDKMWLGGFRIPNVGETESAYKTAFDTALGGKASTYAGIAAGGAKITSGLTYRQYRRSFVIPAAARIAYLSEERDAAVINDGALPGVEIRDVNGNPEDHDEAANPGLEDSRAIVATTHEDEQGVYICNPRLLSAAGSDFELVQHRRVINIAKRALRVYLKRRLSVEIQVDAATGYILESEAQEIETGADAILRAVLRAKPKASGGGFEQGKYVKLSRTDNLISTKKLTGQCKIVPLAYPKAIEFEIGFVNPALKLRAV
jgi:hypothetical protein